MQRCSLCAHRGVQGQIGWESEQLGLVEGVPLPMADEI